MPVPIIAAVITGVIGMVEQNVQQKAAIKNNENQQTAAVQNAATQANKAQASVSPYLQPGQGGTVGSPPGAQKQAPAAAQQVPRQTINPQAAAMAPKPLQAAQAQPAQPGQQRQQSNQAQPGQMTPQQLQAVQALAQRIAGQPASGQVSGVPTQGPVT